MSSKYQFTSAEPADRKSELGIGVQQRFVFGACGREFEPDLFPLCGRHQLRRCRECDRFGKRIFDITPNSEHLFHLFLERNIGK